MCVILSPRTNYNLAMQTDDASTTDPSSTTEVPLMKDADPMPDTDPNRTLPPEMEVSVPSSDQTEGRASENAPETPDLAQQVQAIEEETQVQSSSSSERPEGSGSPNRPRYVYD